MTNERMQELLRVAVDHIESFEEDEAQNVFRSLGFSENEMKEALYGFYLTEEELKNIDMIEKPIIHNGEPIWQLNARGASYIFSDQVEDDAALTGWKTECVPFSSQSHYFYVDEQFGKPVYCAYAWYGPGDSYVNNFESLEECLEWLVSENDLQIDAFNSELINSWTDKLLKRTNKSSLETLSSEELLAEIKEVKGTISNERLWAHADSIHEENIHNLSEYLGMLEECLEQCYRPSLSELVQDAATKVVAPCVSAKDKELER